MNDMSSYLLSSTIFIPLALSLLVLLLPAANQRVLWAISLFGSLWILLASAWLYIQYRGDLELIKVFASWFSLNLGQRGTLQFDFFLLADGLNLPLMLLSGISLTVASLASWRVSEKPKAYFSLFLLLAASISGCFLAMDFLLFFLFFEFMLLPMYFLIGLWGGPRRAYASIKFFIYTLVGSLLILMVMVGMYGNVLDVDRMAEGLGISVDEVKISLLMNEIADTDKIFSVHFVDHSGGYSSLSGINTAGGFLDTQSDATLKGMSLRYWAFLLLLIGFLIKLPAVPFHTWLPDAHVEASTPISVILAAVLLKIGGYGLFRIVYPAFPDAALHFTWWVALLGVVAIIYGALNALAQHDLKKLVAYSSVSHMGFVLVGIASATEEGLNGAYYQLFSHGLISAMLFVLVGVLYDRVHDRSLSNFSGLAKLMPKFAILAGIAFFASLGLPGFSGFVAELMVLIGAFSAGFSDGAFPIWMALAATAGLVLAAGYSLWAYQRVWMGPLFLRNEAWKASLPDLGNRELLMLIPLAFLTVLFGVFPNLLLSVLDTPMQILLDHLKDFRP